jgi:hypothetical protein
MGEVKTNFYLEKIYALNLDKELSMQNFYTDKGKYYSPTGTNFTGGSTRTALNNISEEIKAFNESSMIKSLLGNKATAE